MRLFFFLSSRLKLTKGADNELLITELPESMARVRHEWAETAEAQSGAGLCQLRFRQRPLYR